jgi:hypothetical protein
VPEDHDFGGYATKAGLKCSDGRTITPEAFKHMDKAQVPLVWQHMHDAPTNVLGHASLEHRKDGVYAYCYFNDTDAGKSAKLLVEHKDVDSLSIYANGLVEKSKKVMHGDIREVSLVLSGANPGARIDFVRIAHADGGVEELDNEAVIFTGEALEHADGTKMTYQDVYDSLNEDQKALVEVMLKQALETKQASAKHSGMDADDKDDKDDDEGKSDDKTDDEDKTEDKDGSDGDLEHKENDDVTTRNVFEKGNKDGVTGDGVRPDGRPRLTHSQIQTIFDDGKKMGSFKEAFLAHAEDYGITNIEVLFPDAQAIDAKPEWITRKMAWVEGVLNSAQKLPFSKIKSLSADLTHEEARAKGYIKATMKKEQFFAIAKRETTPKTVYKKQKLDRDDIIDITDFDVVAWLWVEMRFMLREEIARAALFGDGREVDDDDKINENNIRPIAFDDAFYTDVINVPANVGSSDLIEAVLRGRNTYKGTAPTAYMTNGVMVDMLLSKDKLGRRYYNTKAELASALNVSEIVEVDVMEGLEREGKEVLMVIVNMTDYAFGSTRGGEITTFDDFDIDYNQYKYLIETRLSGALTKHKRAQVVLRGAGTLVTPGVPTFNEGTGVVTIPNTANVTYKNQETDATLTAGAQTALDPGETLSVVATPNAGYYFAHNTDNDWDFTRPLA